MAAEYSSNDLQLVASNQSVIFNESPVPCRRGFVYHRDGSGIFRVAGMNQCGCFIPTCCCQTPPEAQYEVAVSGNISVPTGGTAEAIQIAVAIDGEIDPSSTMIFTPAAVEEFGNVSATVIVTVPYLCRCSSVSVRNTSTQAINAQNFNIIFTRVR